MLEQGWTLLVVWECQLARGRLEATMARVVSEVRAAGRAGCRRTWSTSGRPRLGARPLRLVRARRRARRR